MSEDHPTYIPCASGNQAQTEFLIRRHGDLIETIGHPTTHLTPADARSAAKAYMALADAIEGKKPPEIDPEAVFDLIDAAHSLIANAAPFEEGDELRYGDTVIDGGESLTQLMCALERFDESE